MSFEQCGWLLRTWLHFLDSVLSFFLWCRRHLLTTGVALHFDTYNNKNDDHSSYPLLLADLCALSRPFLLQAAPKMNSR